MQTKCGTFLSELLIDTIVSVGTVNAMHTRKYYVIWNQDIVFDSCKEATKNGILDC